MKSQILQLVNGRVVPVTLKEAAKPPVLSDEERLRKYKSERSAADELKKEENK